MGFPSWVWRCAFRGRMRGREAAGVAAVRRRGNQGPYVADRARRLKPVSLRWKVLGLRCGLPPILIALYLR